MSTENTTTATITYGHCAKCGWSHKLNAKGNIPAHKMWGVRCEGSGKAPADTYEWAAG